MPCQAFLPVYVTELVNIISHQIQVTLCISLLIIITMQVGFYGIIIDRESYT